jgi:hypothetical protein
MAFLTGRPRLRWTAAFATVLLCAASPAAQPVDHGEKAVKAAFLYNFTKFVQWPAGAFESGVAPFRVCVFTDPAFRQEIEAMLAGETVGGRPIQVLTPGAAEARGCHLAYFAAAQAERAGALMPALRQAPVLTVGEGPAFLERGGQISFVLENNRVRFDVNKLAVDRTGLTVSSKLLRVARHVTTPGDLRQP